MNIHLPPTLRSPPPVDAASLLRLPGPQFVEAVYTTLLGREPDPDGRVFFRRRLLEGVSKLQIAGEFAVSAEAKARAVPLPGLEEALRQARPVTSGWRHRLQQAFGLVQDRTAEARRDGTLQATLDELSESTAHAAAAHQQQIDALRARLDSAAITQVGAIDACARTASATAGDLKALAGTLQRLQSDVDRLASLALPPRGSARAATSTPLERLAIVRRAGGSVDL